MSAVRNYHGADRCGQRLNWSEFDDVEVRYIGRDGPDGDGDDAMA